MEKYLMIKNSVKNVRRFNLQGRTLEFKLKSVPANEEPVRWIKEAVNQVIDRATQDLSPGDQVSFSFCSKDFARGDGWVRFRPVGEVTYDDVWGVITSVYQSNSTGINTETFCLGVTSVKLPAGNGKYRGRKYNTFEEECGKRRGIISINNKDNLCLPRAIIVAIAYTEKDPEYAKVRRDIGKIQYRRAIELAQDAGVVIPEMGAGISELQLFQHYLSDYKLVVYQYGTKGRDVIFSGSGEGPKLNLLYHERHYNVITSLTAAFCCNYYCEICNIPFNNKGDHRCGGTCPACQQTPACPKDITITCTGCHRGFRSEHCYANHLKPGSLGKGTVCDQIYRCTDCFKVMKRGRTHICGEVYCKICKNHVPADHLCFMQPDTGKPKTADLLFVFYDLETRQEKVQEDGSQLHEPNLCVFQQRCDYCLEINGEICHKCGVRRQVLEGNISVSLFVEYLMNQRKLFKQVVVLAHNGQAFDHQFCLNYIITRTDLKPELIMRGTKIISMMVGNVKFLDSLNYFPMALNNLPKAFGLGGGLKKGYFPHLFNILENENYVGPLPAVEYYDPGNMKEGDRDIFFNWHKELSGNNYIFDFKKEIVEYCISDVEILTAACLRFRQQLLETGNVCPFTEACTIASTCNKVYRRNFLKPDTIGIIPKGGYRWRDNQSKIATQWLVWEEKQRGINIQHTAKQQEARVAGLKVDGFCADTNQVFEFGGCLFHGCLDCYKHNRDAPLMNDPSQTLNSRYEATVAKTERLKELGYEVIEMSECMFRRQLQGNEELRTYSENHPLVALTPLNPRDAFFGGRTGNTVEHHKCRTGEEIKYVDVCSLYPWVCKYGKFPIGHPKVYVGEACTQVSLQGTNGVIKCRILPPQHLYHPVLPTKMNDKLMFVLCSSCGEQMNKDECCHNEEQRALTGTWIIDEVVKAVDMGYRLLEVFEVWAYQTDQFDKMTRKGGLFTTMMNKFIKVKQQASGWPTHCTTEEKKERYIEEFLEREDVKLEFADIIENAGLRSLAKLMLNSFWGKLGQRENQPKTSIVRDPAQFFAMLSNPTINVNSALTINEDTLVVNWEHKYETYDPLATVNVVIAAYVTTQARLKLYSYLEKLGDRVLYYDTDSVIYVSREGQYDVPTGEFLGDMTNELEGYGPNSYISEFVSGGPKNYAYKVFSTRDNEYHVVCKVKGISLNYQASQLINFDSIKDMVLSPSDPVHITSRNIRRTREHEVVTRVETKIYKPNSTKRRFLPSHSSVPYGWKKSRLI